MGATESSVTSPPGGWGRRFPRDEKVFFVLICVVGVAMTAFALGWVIWAGHNVPRETGHASVKEFSAATQAFAERYGDETGRAWVPPGTDAYLLATRYAWYPELVLQAGEEYRIHMSAGDVLHGFSLVGGTQNLNLQLAPNHEFVVHLTPDDPGRYRIVCNEYCGLGHQEMTGFITVVTAAEMAGRPATEPAANEPTVPPASEGLELSSPESGALEFSTDQLEATAGSVTITYTNPSPVPHNVAVKGNGADEKGKIVASGGTSTVTAELASGTYTFYCSVPGHEAAGMKGTLTVK